MPRGTLRRDHAAPSPADPWPGSAALATAVAALLSALGGLAGFWLAKRTADRTGQAERDAETGPYLERLQQWSAQIYAEKDRMLDECLRRCTEQVALVRAECDAELDRTRVAHTRALEDLRIQTRAQVIGAQQREDHWRRAAQGQLRRGATTPGPTRGRRTVTGGG